MFYVEGADGALRTLCACEGGVNRARGEFYTWGETIAPPGVSVRVSRAVTERDTLAERYVFSNETDCMIACPTGSCGVWTPLNTPDAPCGEACHAHVWCGGSSSWINALNVTGRGPHLALALTKGSLASYAVRRRETSDDRGDLCLLLSPFSLAPGASQTLGWEVFFHDGDFFGALRDFPAYHPVGADTFTFFEGEPVTIETSGVPALPEERGLHTVTCSDGAFFRYQILPEKEKLFRARAAFLIAHQQQTAPGPLYGAFLPYDNETHVRVCIEDDPNRGAARERVGMGLFLARYLQTRQDEPVRRALYRYAGFVLRELFDERTGEVFNAVGRNNARRRLYNNAWYASFFREMYRLDGDTRWLSRMRSALLDLYRHGGERFYPLALEATDAIACLRREGMDESELMRALSANCAYMMQNGTDYPGFEVRYEDNIVVPAGMLAVQMFELTGEKRYLDEARRHERRHAAFIGFQPDARMHGAALHHWDDFWFGKRRLYGDTFPHYWITAGALFDARLSRLIGEEALLKRARAAMRTSLSCFFEDGSATCAIVTPFRVNGCAGDFIDPWANDQDWALYHALVFDEAYRL